MKSPLPSGGGLGVGFVNFGLNLEENSRPTPSLRADFSGGAKSGKVSLRALQMQRVAIHKWQALCLCHFYKGVNLINAFKMTNFTAFLNYGLHAVFPKPLVMILFLKFQYFFKKSNFSPQNQIR